MADAEPDMDVCFWRSQVRYSRTTGRCPL